MKYKELFNRLVQILSTPSKAWEEICQEEESGQVESSYVYPMIAICGIALFVGLLFGNGVEEFDFQITLTKCCGLFISLFGGFFLSTYLIEGMEKRLLTNHPGNDKETIKKLVGYSMTVIFVLEFFAAIFPSFFIIRWILQFYLIYIVWEGNKVLMQIPEKQLLSYTLVSSVIILASPVVINYVFNWLSQMAK